MAEPSDEKSYLLQYCRDGDESAIALLVSRYQHKLFGFVLNMMGGDKERAENIVNQSFLSGFGQIPSMKKENSFLGLLAASAIEQCRGLDCKPSFDHSDHAELSKERQQELSTVKYALQTLAFEDRLRILLRHQLEITFEEMGVILNVPVARMKAEVMRAEDCLEEKMKSTELSGLQLKEAVVETGNIRTSDAFASQVMKDLKKKKIQKKIRPPKSKSDAKKPFTERPEFVVVLFVMFAICVPLFLWIGEKSPDARDQTKKTAQSRLAEDREAHFLLRTLQSILDSLTPSSPRVSVQTDSGMRQQSLLKKYLTSIMEAMKPDKNDKAEAIKEKTDAAEHAVHREMMDMGTPGSSFTTNLQAVPPDPDPLHWHVFYSGDSEKTKLMVALRALGIKSRFVAENLMVMDMTGDDLMRLHDEIYFVSKQATPIQTNQILPGAIRPEAEVRLSMYLVDQLTMKEATRHLHWRMRFTLDNRSKFFDLLNQLGVEVRYESDDIVVVRLKSSLYDNLKKSLDGVPGLFVHEGLRPLTRERTHEITISMHMSETEKSGVA